MDCRGISRMCGIGGFLEEYFMNYKSIVETIGSVAPYLVIIVVIQRTVLTFLKIDRSPDMMAADLTGLVDILHIAIIWMCDRNLLRGIYCHKAL